MTNSLRISGDRLWSSLMDMARIGATDKGGCNRQALTDLDRQGRDLFVEWCRQEGCSISIDTMGNIFARRDGRDNDLPPVITGSHLDTQPTGGKFDGVYGVLAGLEVIRSLNECGLETDHPIEVVCWTNEEGARFAPAMIGSGVFGGAFTLQYAYDQKDKDGQRFGDELKRIGYLGDVPCGARTIKAALECHIEQGPILEAEGLPLGIVSGVQGIHWYDVVLTGSPVHAGPTPMDVRRDPFQVLHRLVSGLYELTASKGEWARVTFGDIRAEPGSRNTVPEKVVLSVDLRHPDQSVLDQMEREFHILAKESGQAADVTVEIDRIWQSKAIQFNAHCVAAVRGASDALGLKAKEMVSGAGHDSVYVSRVAPTAMIFVPCEGGISHNEAENAKSEDLADGANVLLNALVYLAKKETEI